jgi:hypothetical protein
MPKSEATIMPANTPVLTARRLSSLAPSTSTSGTRPRMKAKLVIITARSMMHLTPILREHSDV